MTMIVMLMLELDISHLPLPPLRLEISYAAISSYELKLNITYAIFHFLQAIVIVGVLVHTKKSYSFFSS